MGRLWLWVVLCMMVSCSPKKKLPDSQHPDHEIAIGMLVGKLQYDTEAFTVRPDSTVRLSLTNNDQVPHNWVLCDAGREGMIAVVEASLKLGERAIEQQFIPEHRSILAASTLLAEGEQEVLYFRAPSRVGDYHYVCTFPGHAAVMHGVMTVSTK